MENAALPIVVDKDTAEQQQLQSPSRMAATDVEVFERLARDPSVSVEKLRELVELQERVMARRAREEFDAAFAEMQSELPNVVERGKTDKGMYATFEDIIRTVRPILKRHGFSLAFSTAWPDDKRIEITGILTHRSGHRRESLFAAEADKSGSKNAIQAQGSTVAYGRRYTTLDLLGIATEGADDDGRASGRAEAPEGYQQWADDLAATADQGTKELEAVWKASPRHLKEWMVKHELQTWEKAKKKAASVKG